MELGGREPPSGGRDRVGSSRQVDRQLENFCTCRAETKVQNMVQCSEICMLWADGYIRMRDAWTQKWLPPAFPTQSTFPALPVRLTGCCFPNCWKLEGNCWL